jgi:hypothetical protein
LLILGETYTTGGLFFFRYYQTTGHRYLHSFSNLWGYLLGYIIFLLFVAFSLILPLYRQILVTEEARVAFRGDAKISELIRNEPLVFAINVSFLNKKIAFLANKAF